jgi:hypothetical protein
MARVIAATGRAKARVKVKVKVKVKEPGDGSTVIAMTARRRLKSARFTCW